MVMVDLENLLTGPRGVTIGSHTMGGVFHAEEIILFANAEAALQDMLNVISQFGYTWGLNFNSKKSQVMVIGEK